ncbi:hypothetical protein A3J91_01360 [Candidatus Peribacteria bacterium RIFOXYC2_FULL_58_10]|nr:MAG: hypothetical protein A3J91_01360 [Candidatus Peribacteria bacterium RIFOXYC2_FULL_58_10]
MHRKTHTHRVSSRGRSRAGFTRRPLYRSRSSAVDRWSFSSMPRRITFVLMVVALVAPLIGGAKLLKSTEPYEQEFVITAYYSPRPGQCCYVTGGERPDRVLNGEGRAGADGTPVYPGMIAAPASYAFGTRVTLPGLGTFEVNDRGGAINEQADGTHRLDIWVGEGEEGLARALAFGVRRVRGTVYPVESTQPAVSFALATILPVFERLAPYRVTESLLAVRPALGDRGPSVEMLQQRLKDAGYFPSTVSGFFGEETRAALQTFLKDYRIDEPSSALTERAAAYIAAAAWRSKVGQPVSGVVEDASPAKVVAEAQRILRFLKYYYGRTNGVYGPGLKASILKFQQAHGLVGTEQSPGAGRIGPITMRSLTAEWNRTLVARRAQMLLDKRRIMQLLAQRGELLDEFLSEGDQNNRVRMLQTLLAREGYFPENRISGTFGEVTKAALLKYQLEKGIVSSVSQNGAGRVGPATLREMAGEKLKEFYGLVRANGWRAL